MKAFIETGITYVQWIAIIAMVLGAIYQAATSKR